METTLPNVIATYITAKNAFDVKATVACFSHNAVVHDEARDHKGKIEIKTWIEETIRAYKDQLRPILWTAKDGKLVLTAEISGTFDGNPIELDFHFTVEQDKIADLSVQ